jgi:hypothetical protein
MTDQRLTLIAHETGRGWRILNAAAAVPHDIGFVEEPEMLRTSLLATLGETTLDVERVILDDAGTPEMFLELLARLPSSYAGDVLRVDRFGRGFLSATGRGGDRVLYALEPEDVRFYLAACSLIPGQSSNLLEMTA